MHTPWRDRRTTASGGLRFQAVPAVTGFLLTALLGLSGAQASLSAQSDPLLEEWRWSRFTAESGTPDTRMRAVTSTTTGIVWAFTNRDLVWFDGFRWHHAEGGPTARVERLTADAEGGILAVAGGSVWQGDEAGLTEMVLERDGRTMPATQAVALGDGGDVLFESGGQLYRHDGQRVLPFENPFADGSMEEGALARTDRGTVWFLSSGSPGGSYEWTGEEWVMRQPYRSALVHEGDGWGVVAVNHSTDVNGLWSWTAEDPEPRRLPGEDPSLVSAMAGRGENAVVVYRSGRVRVRRGDGWQWLATVPMDLDNAHALHVDGEGDLWVATDRGLALHQSSSERWSRWSPGGDFAAVEVNTLALDPEGDLWVGTPNGLYRRHADGSEDHISQIQGQPLGVVTSVTRGPDGSIWVSSGADWEGAFRWRNGSWEHVGEAQGLRAGRVHRIAVDRQDRLWFLGLSAQPGVDEPGAYVYEDGDFTRWGIAEGLPSGRVYAFADAPDGSLWFGTAESLSRWADGQWTHWTMSNGLVRPRVYALAAAGGRIWFGHLESGGGLGFVDADGEVGYLTEADGLVDERVWDIQAGADGAIWLGTGGGVARYADGRFATFDWQTGLGHPRVWPIVPTSDRVYVGTAGGGVYELSLAEQGTPPPLVEIEPLLVDDDRVSAAWSALAYRGEVAPEAIETRFRIDDAPWSEWSGVRQVVLSVSPGDHVFEVEAKGMFGEVSGAPASAGFTVPPPLFRHPLVLSIGLLWALTGMAFVVHYGRRRREHVEMVKRSEQRLRRLVDQMPICIHEVDLDGRLRSMNPAGLAMMGVGGESDILGLPYLSAVAEEDRPHVESLLERARSGEACEFQFRARTVDGPRVFASSLAPLRDEEGAIVKLMGYTQDMTEKVNAEEEGRRLEEALRQVQKMEAVGQLAGGVAHDFNNLLTVIGGYASMIAEGSNDDPQAVREDVEQILEAHGRAQSLTRQLLAFGRRQVLEPQVVDVRESVQGLEGMLSRLISEDLTLDFQIADDVGHVRVDPSGIEQVIINLVVNARDAVEPGGTIRISAFNSTLDAPKQTPAGSLDPGDYVVIEVADDGIGMDAATQAKVFEPFFTTKPVGQGTGLGLSTAYGIVAQSRGAIRVESMPGNGSRLSVYLPKVAGQPRKARRAGGAGDAELNGSETVLVAEDNDAVRELVASTLSRYGYTVLTAPDGAKAAQMAASHPGAVDALVTDLIMPELNGRDLAERFRGIRPDAVVLVMSGYADQSVLGDGPSPTVDLKKPFPPMQLARLLRQRLDERRARSSGDAGGDQDRSA